MPFARFTVSLSEPQHNKLREIAKEKEVSLVQIVREACEHYTNNGVGSHQFGAHTETDSKYFSNLEKQLQTKDDQLVTKDQQIQRAVDQTVSKFGYPSVLFNNAGIAVVGEIEQITPDDWDHQYEVNVKSIYLVSRAVIPVMRQAGGGSIINMGSESAFVGFPMHPAYTSSKAAVVHLTRSMAVRYAPEKIRVNSLCPGTINTELLTEFLAQQDDPEAVKEEIRDMHPLGIGEPEDIAWAAVYLASDESKYMTGAPMLVEGGILTL